MSKGKRPSFKHFLFHGVVLFTMAASKAAAAVVPFWNHEDVTVREGWKEISRELAGTRSEDGLNQDIVDMVQSPTFGADLEGVVRLTYAMARVSDFAELDDLWVNTLMRRSGSDTVAAFIAVRSEILGLDQSAAGGVRFGDSWLWQAKGGRGGGGRGDS
jgi:hypothetical protein